MSLSEPSADRVAAATNHSYLQWGGVFAGALIAGAIFFVLISFGAGLGLSVAPSAGNWRSPTVMFSVLSGVWVLAATLGAMSAGGYVAGRMRSRWHVTHTHEVEFRDGVHGLVVWALAIAIGATLSLFGSAALVAGAVGAARTDATAPTPAGVEVDRLLLPEHGWLPLNDQARAQAGRLLLAATTQTAVSAGDRSQLIDLVAANAAITPLAAQFRVDQAIDGARAKLTTARHASIILAFITAASLLIAAAAAWEAACVGGRHRDGVTPPSLAWVRPGMRGVRPGVAL
ncbi:MAG: hypothetical protein JWM33_1904 [Caulobacteraceae bacterium]|nr:hypothetical protein [Caulobacteraceae bacterium]